MMCTHVEKWVKVENVMYIMKNHVGTYDHVAWQARDGTLGVMAESD